MENLSKQNILENCSHCSPNSQAFKYLLLETENFRVVCDIHPICEGHILIIPKEHLSCIGEYSEELFKEFLSLYNKFSEFLLSEYHSVSTFEHGKYGQTVFHSHVHLLPFKGDPVEIIPEGKDKFFELNDLSKLKELFKKQGGYLFFSIEDSQWTVDLNIAAPRFFRDRFATALGRPERGNWKEMRQNKDVMEMAVKDDLNTKLRWNKYKTPH